MVATGEFKFKEGHGFECECLLWRRPEISRILGPVGK